VPFTGEQRDSVLHKPAVLLHVGGYLAAVVALATADEDRHYTIVDCSCASIAEIATGYDFALRSCGPP